MHSGGDADGAQPAEKTRHSAGRPGARRCCLARVAFCFYLGFILATGLRQLSVPRNGQQDAWSGRLGAWLASMFGFGYLLVPLYDVMCKITGIGGRTQRRGSHGHRNAPGPVAAGHRRVRRRR